MYYSEMLKGACDIHVHTMPCIVPRELDIAEMTRRADRAGYAAVVVKDHHYCTAQAVSEVMQILDPGTVKVFGSIALNAAVGGMDPYVVESAIAFGAKTVWFPTVSAENNIEHVAKLGNPSLGIYGRPVFVTGDDGELLPETCSVLKVIAEHPDVVLGTGHINAAQTQKVLEKAFELGIKNVFVDHPTMFGGVTLEETVRWAQMGAYIEHTATGSLPGSTVFHTHHCEVLELISAVGAERTVISSDAGQKGNGDPIEDLDKFLKLLSLNGVSDSELELMVKGNTRKLLGI